MRKDLHKHTTTSFWRMPECREMTKVITASMDDRLSWSEWLLMKAHLVACDPCSNFLKQIKFIRTALGNAYSNLGQQNNSISLSTDARHRIKTALETARSV